MQISTAEDMYFDQLDDIHSVECQLVDEWPQLLKRCTSSTLREALLRHADETQAQRARLEEIFAVHVRPAASDPSLAMKGLLEGGRRHLDRVSDPDLRDLLLLAHWSRIEHYEVAAYRMIVLLARAEEWERDLPALNASLNEEERTLRFIEQASPGMLAKSVGSGPADTLWTPESETAGPRRELLWQALSRARSVPRAAAASEAPEG